MTNSVHLRGQTVGVCGEPSLTAKQHPERGQVVESQSGPEILRRRSGPGEGALHQASSRCQSGGGCTILHIQFSENAGDMCGNGAAGDKQRVGNLLVSCPSGDKAKHVELSASQHRLARPLVSAGLA